LRIRCNSHDLSHFGICERDRNAIFLAY
jgi:hypothetical protein